MPNAQQYEAFDPKTGQHWDYDGTKWNLRAPQQSTVSKVWSGANKPLVSAESIAKADPTQSLYDKWTNKAESAGDPTLARIASFLSGSNKDATKMVSSFTSPLSIALAAASGGESALGDSFPAIKALLKTIQTGAGLGFGAQETRHSLEKRSQEKRLRMRFRGGCKVCHRRFLEPRVLTVGLRGRVRLLLALPLASARCPPI